MQHDVEAVARNTRTKVNQRCGRIDEHVEKQVLRRLELCYRLGKGAYGMVWKVIEKRTRRVVALKKCFDVLGRSEDAQRMYREIMYLQALSAHAHLPRREAAPYGVQSRRGDGYVDSAWIEVGPYSSLR